MIYTYKIYLPSIMVFFFKKKSFSQHNLAYIKFYMILQIADLLTTFITCGITSIRLGGAELFTIASLVFGKCLNVIKIIIFIDRTVGYGWLC